jgi:hypothetical protein
MGTRENAKKRKTKREMDRWSKTEHDKHRLREEDTGDRDKWRNIVWVKENHCRVDKP